MPTCVNKYQIGRIQMTLNDALSRAQADLAQGKTNLLSLRTLQSAWKAMLSPDEIEQLVVPKRTLARRKSEAANLNQVETDRAFRVAHVIKNAERVFGDKEKAHHWLRSSRPQFSGQTPLSMLATEVGTRMVEEILGQIDHGMFS
jgi:putative toxin-antitoxin system antitoxin component (TIGR02293 family)